MERLYGAVRACAAATALALTGCGAAAMPDPGLAARALADAIADRDAARVHALLDADSRRALDLATLAALLEANGQDLDRVAEALRRGAAEVTPSARVDLGHGDEALLVVEDGAFRIDGGAAALVTLATPEEAVRALRSALQRGDLRAVLRVLSRDTRIDIETEVARVLDETADALDIEVATSGDEATVRLTGGRTLHLVREDGEWHVIDLP